MSTLTALDTLLTLVCNMLSAHATMLFVPGDDSYSLISAANAGMPIPRACNAIPGTDVVGWAISSRDLIVINDFNSSYELPDCYSPKGKSQITAFLAAPLPNGGALCADLTDSKRGFSNSDKKLIMQFVNLAETLYQFSVVAGLQDNATSYLDAAAELQLLSSTATTWKRYICEFMDSLRNNLNMEYGALILLNEEADQYIIEYETSQIMERIARILPKSAGMVGYCLTEGTPFFAEGIDGTETAPLFGYEPGMPLYQAVVCVPVRHFNKVCGVMVFASKKGKKLGTSLRSMVMLASGLFSGHLDMLSLQHRVQSIENKLNIVTGGMTVNLSSAKATMRATPQANTTAFADTNAPQPSIRRLTEAEMNGESMQGEI